MNLFPTVEEHPAIRRTGLPLTVAKRDAANDRHRAVLEAKCCKILENGVRAAITHTRISECRVNNQTLIALRRVWAEVLQKLTAADLIVVDSLFRRMAMEPQPSEAAADYRRWALRMAELRREREVSSSST